MIPRTVHQKGRKKVVVSYPDDGKDELDRIATEMNLQPDDDEPQVIESKSSAPARARSKQDSEGQIEKLGAEALEPRRVSVPLPGGEVQAMTPAYKKMLRRLEGSVALYKLHFKHITCLLLNSEEGLPCLDFLILCIKSMKMCVTSVVCVVLPLHHRREPGFLAYEPLTLEMSSLLAC